MFHVTLCQYTFLSVQLELIILHTQEMKYDIPIYNRFTHVTKAYDQARMAIEQYYFLHTIHVLAFVSFSSQLGVSVCVSKLY